MESWLLSAVNEFITLGHDGLLECRSSIHLTCNRR
jgi:hypothetical protein